MLRQILFNGKNLVNSDEDKSNAIALFLNGDIDRAYFGGYLIGVKRVSVGASFDAYVVDMKIHYNAMRVNIENMPKATYDLLKQDIKKMIDEYVNK